MELKWTIELKGLSPQIVLAALVADGIYKDFGAECVITSANDSIHMKESKHYKGEAIDLRTHRFHDLGVNVEDVVRLLKASLGTEFDVVYEGKGTPNEHIHVEYDPS